jgi:hypothetical protein
VHQAILRAFAGAKGLVSIGIAVEKAALFLLFERLVPFLVMLLSVSNTICSFAACGLGGTATVWAKCTYVPLLLGVVPRLVVVFCVFVAKLCRHTVGLGFRAIIHACIYPAFCHRPV